MTDVRPAGIPSDTTVDVWKLQMAALRRLAPEERARVWLELQTEIDRTQRDAVRRKYPHLPDRAISAVLVKRRHGAELAGDVYPEIDLSDLR